MSNHTDLSGILPGQVVVLPGVGSVTAKYPARTDDGPAYVCHGSQGGKWRLVDDGRGGLRVDHRYRNAWVPNKRLEEGVEVRDAPEA